MKAQDAFGTVLTAMVTPFTSDGTAIDFDAAAQLANDLVDLGNNGLVVNGTTGESPTTDEHEKLKLLQCVVEAVGDRARVVAGAGSNDTAHSVLLAKDAAKAGAHGLLVVTPYYNKPTQEGLYRHFRAIAEAVDIPQILYNVPGRTVADMQNDTVLRLAQVPNIIGIKEATGNMERNSDLIRRKPAEFLVFSGDDATCLPLMLLGGHGVISVTANVAAKAMHELCAAALDSDIPKAREINDRLLGLHQHLFCEANPIPVKWAAQQMGLIKAGIRLPLTPLSPAFHDRVRNAMRQAGIAA